MRLKIFIFLLFFSSVLMLNAQANLDTINLAVGFRDSGKYKDMYKILALYRISHPNDVNVEWLYGQAAFFCGKNKEMNEIYEKNIDLHQSNYYLQLDYAIKTAESGNLEKGKKMLEQHLIGNADNPVIFLHLAKIEYWQSNYNAALNYAQIAKQLSKDTKEADVLISSIVSAKAMWVDISYSHFSDKQPIVYMTPVVSCGKFINRFFTPSLIANSQLIDTWNTFAQTYWLRFNNSSQFSDAGLTVRSGLGVFVFPNDESRITGLLGLDKSLFNHFTFTVQAERKPYMLLKSSFNEAIMFTDFNTKLAYNNPNGVMGQVAYNASLFDDGNRVATASAWVVSPALKFWKFGMQAGYGFGYTDSKEDSYSSQKTKEELFYQIDTNSNVAGAFASYVTPMEQQVHSVICVLTAKPFKFMQLSVSGSYGFFASIKSPYLYGYYNENSEVVIEKAYFKQEFHPFQLSIKSTFTISKMLDARIEYSHGYPDYYNITDHIEVGLKLKLIHD